MKRRITVEQLRELTEEQKVNLVKLYKPKEFDVIAMRENKSNYPTPIQEFEEFQLYGLNMILSIDELPLLDIGQMIEMLQENKIDLKVTANDLCDALWEYIKQML